MIIGKIENDLERGFVEHRLSCLLITDPKNWLHCPFKEIEMLGACFTKIPNSFRPQKLSFKKKIIINLFLLLVVVFHAN